MSTSNRSANSLKYTLKYFPLQLSGPYILFEDTVICLCPLFQPLLISVCFGTLLLPQRLFPFFVYIVQLLSCVQLFLTPWSIARQATLSSTISWSLLKFMSIESLMLFDHLILCYPYILDSLSSFHLLTSYFFCLQSSLPSSLQFSLLLTFLVIWVSA